MAYEFKKHKMIDGKRYGPTSNGWYYKPLDYHGKVSKEKSKKGRKAKEAEHKDKSPWILDKSQQYDVFLEGVKGTLKVYALKERRYKEIDGWGEIELPKRSRAGVKDNLIDYGNVISAFSIPKGSVMEFFDKVLLLKDHHSYIIEEEPTIRTRSFMSSNRYQDLLSVTKEETITLHALDTLNVARNEIKGKIQNSATLADVFNDIGLNMPVVGGDNDSELPF